MLVLPRRQLQQLSPLLLLLGWYTPLLLLLLDLLC
jgi:hypothetical protein